MRIAKVRIIMMKNIENVRFSLSYDDQTYNQTFEMKFKCKNPGKILLKISFVEYHNQLRDSFRGKRPLFLTLFLLFDWIWKCFEF